jgi:hypothetical protein
MIKRIKTKRFKANFVLRHRWEKGDTLSNYTASRMKNEWELGIWAKQYDVVGPVRKGKSSQDTIKKTFTAKNHVKCYMFGINLIVCKMWVDFSFKPTFGIDVK